MASIDIKRLAADVSAQHGIRIDSDDPMMAVVTLNRLVFEHAIAQVLEQMQIASHEFESASEKTQVRAGAVLAQEIRECGRLMRQEVASAIEDAAQRKPIVHPKMRQLIGPKASLRSLMGGFVLSIGLIGVGIWIGVVIR